MRLGGGGVIRPLLIPGALIVSLPQPTLVQHVASSTNPEGLGIAGNSYKLPLHNAVGAGNCLILGISYPNGNTAAVTDNNGNTWGAATVTANAGAGKYVAAIFVLPNANAGMTTLTVSFGSDVVPFNYRLSEYCNIATVSPGSGSHGAANVAGSSLAAGSFTPTNNDATGGNLIWGYFATASSSSSVPSSFSAGGSFTLLDGDIGWQSNSGFNAASMVYTQTAAAAINPGMTANGDTTNHYNCVAVALKAGNAGTPKASGIHVDKILHFTNNSPASPQTFQIPSAGNLRVLVTANPPGGTDITGVVDSEGHAWHEIDNAGESPQMFYWDGASPNNALTVDVTFSGTSANYSFRYLDISGAVSSNALDASAEVGHTTANNQSSMANQPSLTPATNKGVAVACMGIATGPGLAVTSPSGAAWGLCTYTNELDFDFMENADAFGIYYYNSTAAQNWTWTITSQSINFVFSTAAAFKSA